MSTGGLDTKRSKGAGFILEILGEREPDDFEEYAVFNWETYEVGDTVYGRRPGSNHVWVKNGEDEWDYECLETGRDIDWTKETVSHRLNDSTDAGDGSVETYPMPSCTYHRDT